MDAIEDERLLLLQIAEGDKVAFKRMYDHYWDDMYALALPFLKSTEAAQDTVQEVFLKVWIKRESLPSVERLHAYIFIMLRNELVSVLRSRGRIARLHERYRRQLPSNFLVADPAVDLKELEGLIRAAIAQLPPPQDQLMEMTRQQGLSHEEIAERLGMAKKTVSNTLTKALSNIRKYLRDHGT